MSRNELKILIDVVLLTAAVVAFTSGFLLLFGFHVGNGVFRASAMGLSRLAWLNLHRLSALALTAALGLHLALNWKAFAARLRRGFSRKSGSKNGSELILYLTFGAAAITGLVVWLIVGGSAPLTGPVRFGPLPHTRHRFVDIHYIVGLVALVLTVHHVGHRWRRMVRGIRSVLLKSPEVALSDVTRSKNREVRDEPRP